MQCYLQSSLFAHKLDQVTPSVFASTANSLASSAEWLIINISIYEYSTTNYMIVIPHKQ